jgi:aspartate racemase
MNTSLTTRTVGILGGMGPAAGADFTRLFVQACEAWLRERDLPVVDQSFPEHWLAQIPLPARNTALLEGAASPLPGMIDAMRRLSSLGATSVAIACNTAHAWHAELQSSCPGLRLLHIVDETLNRLKADGVRTVGILSTSGTRQADLYESALGRAGFRCHAPRDDEQTLLMRGIEQVKAGDLVSAEASLRQVAERLVERHGLTTLVLACTEIPLALQALPNHAGVTLLNPADLLARALAASAYASPRVAAEDVLIAASFKP